MPFTGSREPGKSVLPSFATWPILAAALWVAIAPWIWVDASRTEKAAIGCIPAGVIVAFALADYVVWRRRGRPWHDPTVILLLLPVVAAAVWVGVGALVLDLGLSRTELLGIAVGPGIALVGLSCTTISYHGRHHPQESARGG
jgi:putative flippase GtrA